MLRVWQAVGAKPVACGFYDAAVAPALHTLGCCTGFQTPSLLAQALFSAFRLCGGLPSCSIVPATSPPCKAGCAHAADKCTCVAAAVQQPALGAAVFQGSRLLQFGVFPRHMVFVPPAEEWGTMVDALSVYVCSYARLVAAGTRLLLRGQAAAHGRVLH